MKAKLYIAIVICCCLCSCKQNSSFILENHKLYEYIEKMDLDTSIEKRNNPESCYQVINGDLYLLENSVLYKVDAKDKRLERIVGNVRSFLVTPQYIYYCTEIGIIGNSLRCCDLQGKNDKRLYSNVDVCTIGEKEGILLLSGHINNWSLGEYDLEKNAFTEREVNSNASPQYTCYADNKFIYAETYVISSTDCESGEVEELWSMYDEKEALAEVTCIYVHDNKIYYGVKSLKKDNNSLTGLWRMDLNGKNKEQLNTEEVWELCFVGKECVIIR